jgi:hypothetical protein
MFDRRGRRGGGGGRCRGWEGGGKGSPEFSGVAVLLGAFSSCARLTLIFLSGALEWQCRDAAMRNSAQDLAKLPVRCTSAIIIWQDKP